MMSARQKGWFRLRNISLALSFILVIFLLSFFFSLEQSSSFSYSLTKAICEGNTCRDYEIRCADNGDVVAMVPLTGFVTFPSSWIDTREKGSLCS